METIRVVQNITLNKGNGMANGLYNLSCCITDDVSYWFDEDTKEWLMSLPDNEFVEESIKIIESTN